MSVDAARSHPVSTVLSGPAGGVNGAAFIAAPRAGYDRILTFDMGGTSTDVAVSMRRTSDDHSRDARGQFPVGRRRSTSSRSAPAVARSRTSRPVTGALRVGPQSAGADPGPACYGRGGAEPTVTDANVVLGHLPPRLLGGAMELDADAAQQAVGRIADEIEIDVHRAAAGHRRHRQREHARCAPRGDRAEGARSEGLRARLVRRRRRTPRKCARGAARLLPGRRAARARRALGARLRGRRRRATSSARRSSATTDRTTTAEMRAGCSPALGAQADELAGRGARRDRRPRDVSYVADMRYRRQGYEIPIEVDRRPRSRSRGAGRCASAARTTGCTASRCRARVELVNLRARAVGRVTKPTLRTASRRAAILPQPGRASGDVGRGRAPGDPAVRAIAPRYRHADRGTSRSSQQYDATTLVLVGYGRPCDPLPQPADHRGGAR